MNKNDSVVGKDFLIFLIFQFYDADDLKSHENKYIPKVQIKFNIHLNFISSYEKKHLLSLKIN